MPKGKSVNRSMSQHLNSARAKTVTPSVTYKPGKGWVSLCKASKLSGYDKSTLSLLAKQGKIMFQRAKVEVPTVMVYLPEIKARRKMKSRGPKLKVLPG